MQKYQFVVLLLLVSLFPMTAQTIYEYWNNAENVQCPFDTSKYVVWPSDWYLYHTMDDKWDGEVDSSWCISVKFEIAPPNTYMYLEAEAIDGARPVFIRHKPFDVPEAQLQPDWMFSLESLMQLRVELETSDSGAGPASAFIVGFDIPDENNLGRNQRINYLEFQDSTNAVVSACLASERFEDQHLKELIYQLKFRPHDEHETLIEFSYMSFSSLDMYNFGVVSQHEVPGSFWTGNDYRISIGNLSNEWAENFLLPYTLQEYPSSAHLSYWDLTPALNVDTIQNIVVVVDPYVTLTAQPFTAFRGGLVGGSDSSRHHVTLENNGGDFCIYSVEVNFEEGTEYRHKFGNITLGSDQGCMMFKAGSKFEMAPKASLVYGNPGSGFLAMKAGSELILREGSHLSILNTLVLHNSANTAQSPTAYIYPGSHLIFAESAHLLSWGNPDLKFRIIMLGGTVDDHALSPMEQQLIEYVYPDAEPYLSNHSKLTAIQDPSGHELRLHYATPSPVSVTFRIFDATGRPVAKESAELLSEDSYHVMDIRNLPTGWFAVTAETHEGTQAAAFIHFH